MNYSIDNIQEILKGEEAKIINGGLKLFFNKAMPLTDADAQSIIWLKPGGQNANSILEKSPAPIVVCNDASYEQIKNKQVNKVFILVHEPKRIFSKIVNTLFVKKLSSGIHASACIHPNARIGSGCHIGPFTFIGEVELGDNTIIHGNCHIYDNVKIGSHCIIHAGVVIGSDGFGFSRGVDGQIEKFPHIGGVIIGNDVEIGANTCIDRGSLGNTIIQNGVKIDNLVHIAHNVHIQTNAFIIANAMIGGSTQIGKGAWIAPSVSMLQQLHIGQNVTVGVGAVVTKDIPDGETWTGVPARPLEDFLLLQKKMKKLPE